MLLSVSKALQGFLQATVAPPDETPIERWVQIAGNDQSSGDGRGELHLSLYEVEPDPFLRNVRGKPEGGTYGPTPLPLTLHYMVTYPVGLAEHRHEALGGVLRAFHTQPSLNALDYLAVDESKQVARDGTIASALQVLLELPAVEKLGHMWSAQGNGAQLALFYRVNVALIPAFLQVRTVAVDGFDPPIPHPMPSGGGGAR